MARVDDYKVLIYSLTAQLLLNHPDRLKAVKLIRYKCDIYASFLNVLLRRYLPRDHRLCGGSLRQGVHILMLAYLYLPWRGQIPEYP